MLTTQDIAMRRTSLGASEIAAVAGVDQYRTAHDIYLIKTGAVPEFAGNEATKRGQRLEPVLLDYAAEEIGRGFDRQAVCRHHSGLLHATVDGKSDPSVGGEQFLVEAKSSGTTEGWGEDGTDAVPDRVLMQTHHQFLCAGEVYRICYVPVIFPTYRGFDFRLFKITRNDRLCSIVEDIGVNFMSAVMNGIPPSTPPSLETLKIMQRVPKKAVRIHEDLVTRWLEAKEAAKPFIDAEEQAKCQLLSALGDAEIGESDAGIVTYGVTKTSRFNLSKFKAEQPQLAESYIEQSEYRTLRHKKPAAK